MMTDNLKTAFGKEKQAPELMDAKTYQATLEKLLAAGQGYGKTEEVGGFLLQDIKLVTETSSGKDETAKNIAVEKLYVVMDVAQYPSEYLRGLVVKDIARNWGGKTIHERDLESPDFKVPGIWTIKKSAFEGDYMPKDPDNATSSTFVPNPEAYRVTLQVDEAVKVPVQWGDFTIEAGGVLAMREKDAPALAEALQSIRDGKATPEEALYTTDKGGNTVALFDIYGMEPGFLEGNYAPVALSRKRRPSGKASCPRVAPRRRAVRRQANYTEIKEKGGRFGGRFFHGRVPRSA